MRVIGRLLMVAMMAIVVATPALAAKRVALVIGNSDYRTLPDLANPVKDAKAIASQLETIGFDRVVMLSDLDLAAFNAALEAIDRDARGSEVALLYYAGHAVEIGGEFFVVPVNATLASAEDLQFEAVSLSALRQHLASTAARVMIFDSSRSNPFGKVKLKQAAPVNSYVGADVMAFATGPGEVAMDDEGGSGHSPFTAAVMNALERPGLELKAVFRAIMDEVLQSTEMKQSPWMSSSGNAESMILHAAKK